MQIIVWATVLFFFVFLLQYLTFSVEPRLFAIGCLLSCGTPLKGQEVRGDSTNLQTTVEFSGKTAFLIVKAVPPIMVPEYGDISTQYCLKSGQQLARDWHVGWHEHESKVSPHFLSHVCPVRQERQM